MSSTTIPLPRPGLPAALPGWWAEERPRAVLWLPVALAVGIALYFASPTEPPLAAGTVVLAVLLAAAVALRGGPALLLLGGLAAIAGGFAAAQWRTALATPRVELPFQAGIWQGTVRAVDLLPDTRRVVLDAPSVDGAAPLPRTVRIRLRPADTAPLASGDVIRVRALVRPPPAPAFPGAWDFQRDAFFAGHAGTGTALGPIEVVDHARGGTTLAIQRLRDAINARLAQLLPGAEGAIAAALLTGATSAIPQADLAAFRDSGLFHLLSVSGLHMAIVVGLVMAVVRLGLAASGLAARLPAKAIAAVAALAAGLFYLLLTGSQIPTLRSYLMAGLVLVAVLAGRRAITLRSLALAASLVLLAAPEALPGPSFQMSFAAVLALIAGYAALRPWFDRLRGRQQRLRAVLAALLGLVASSVLAGLATAPITVFHFGTFQAWGVIANMVAVPLTSLLVMPAGVAGLLLMPLGLDAPALALMGWGIQAIGWVAAEVASWPAAAPRLPPPPVWGLAAFVLGALWLAIWRTRLRLLGAVPLLAGLASPLLAHPPDLLVSPDARLIAWREDGAAWLARAQGAPTFQLDQFARHWGVRGFVPVDQRGCPPAGCRLFDARVLLAVAPPRTPVCDAALVVSPEPIRARCPGVPWIDRFSVWRDGAHAVWLTAGGVTVLSDRAHRGERPWVPPVPVPRARPQPGTTLAPAVVPPADGD